MDVSESRRQGGGVRRAAGERRVGLALPVGWCTYGETVRRPSDALRDLPLR